jgi:RNA polymerase sigma factor (sigma-70 family)
MSSASDLTTSLDFLARLRDWRNNEAWEKFMEDYHPVMLRWALRCVPSPVDAEEVAAGVLAKLPQAIRSFQHDGRERGFRNYLLVAIRNAARDFLKKPGKCPGGQGTGDSAVAALLNEVADSASVVELEQELSEAVAKVNAQTAEAVDAVKASLRSPTTWRAFQLHVLEERPAREVAAELGIPLGSVFVYAFRVRTRLRLELESRQPQPPGGRRNGQ